ncbi:pentatricopeptide repeat-containing protein [Tanacetum coccineum]
MGMGGRLFAFLGLRAYFRNGYLRKGRKTKPKRQNRARNGKAGKDKSKSKPKPEKVNPSQLRSQKSRKYAKTLELFGEIMDCGFERNYVSYTAGISAYAKVMDVERGKEVHDEAVTNGFGSDRFVQVALLDM